jgi:hypothetical protein
MTLEELDRLLVEWGALSKYEESKREGATDFHALQRARDYAPGTKEKAMARLVDRDGRDRRRLLARDLAGCGVRIVPKDYVDPVPGKTTHKATPSERVGDSIPPRLRAVHDSALELYRVDKIAGLVLRQEYCAYGSQGAKTYRVGEAMGKKIGLRIYRESLARAKGWMLGRMQDRAAAA